jgi:hypothetical protein
MNEVLAVGDLNDWEEPMLCGARSGRWEESLQLMSLT